MLVNADKPSAVSAARVNVANPSAVSAARVNAVRLSAVSAARINAVKPSAVTAVQHNHTKKGNPQQALKDKGVIDSGCSRHMTGNISYLSDFKEMNGGYVAFGGNPKGGKIIGKDFMLPDASQVLLRVPRENNMYNVNLKNIIPFGDFICLFAKATLDESNLWNRRLGHVNFKTINKLVKGNLVRGLPSKVFTNDLTCVACKKGKQHRASCKSKTVSSVDQPLFRLHIDLFGPTIVKSLSKKSYCLVVTDDYSRFSWVFFLASKDETPFFLKTFIIGLENLLSLKVKIIRCDNKTKFKNYDLTHFYGLKGIKREFSVPKTPQQNGIVERKNRTLIEAARTLLLTSRSMMEGMLPLGEEKKVVRKLDFEDVYFVNKLQFNLFSVSQMESSSSSLNDDVQQSPEEVILPSTNTQSISINMVPNGDEASTSHNVFNEQLDDAYFDASTSFHDPSNVHTYYQPYPHEKKWTKDHLLHKITGDPKSSVRTRGQLANSCLFSCLLSSIKPANVAKALKDTDWVSAMQEELDQFTRLKVWRLVP
uniref:Putative ribonuclease H-like domain-containing protein n=1 Tax=Tanacetum cinerariifolium TaxID=118510 RepID=A0A6L2LWP5_TANCI|nr:putative ribonuclease H-like domain-containing protein [Tanacetum cinerariifolium]